MDDITQEAKYAVDVVKNAGRNLKNHFGKTESGNLKTTAASVVTKLDIETEQFIFQNLKQKFPQIGFKGEEMGAVDIATGKFWLADPIDGTAYFIRGVQGCTTMLALVDNGKVVLGIIYDFVNDILYHAQKDKGAYSNSEPIHASDRDPKNALLSVECNINQSVLEQFLEINKRYDVIAAGYPAGNQLAMVACGQIEGRICLNSYGKDYDFAPGALLIQEAGGVVANIGKSTYDYTNYNFIAANKKLYESLTSGKVPIFPIME